MVLYMPRMQFLRPDDGKMSGSVVWLHSRLEHVSLHGLSNPIDAYEKELVEPPVRLRDELLHIFGLPKHKDIDCGSDLC